MYNYLQYAQSLCSPYTEQTASQLPNPTPVEGEVRFYQAPPAELVNEAEEEEEVEVGGKMD